MDYTPHLRSDGNRLIAAARHAPDARVPSCPDWDVTTLVAHTGAIYEWVADILRHGEPTAPDRRRPEDEPGGFDGVAERYEQGLGALLDAVQATDPDTQVWNWFDRGMGPARFWFRRMAQETVVHRWDAEDATAQPLPIDATLAADGIDEYLSLLAKRLTRNARDGLAGSFALRPTDGTGPWQFELRPDGIDRRSGGTADALISGPTSDLYLWLLHRTNSAAVSGDAAVVARWDEVRFE